jgi:glycosyltransferase involved in cell wall biosynthesis
VLARRLYYFAKPLLPRSVQIWLRRLHARRALARSRHRWPIDPKAGAAPANWPGWPEGKRFALILTHDVEGQRGIERVRRLAELEMELGLRSSFNFIPEGGDPVPAELRAWLVENGFEVGVHDLYHDGKLYSSREHFRECAQKINRYTKEWGAAGFRSGFMLHNLDWTHDLDIEYDASTFDTDPFEPQPDGVGTIFPFWVPAPKGTGENGSKAGFVELPYTLVQDFNLFVVLGEKTADIWRQKIDWIVARGGMALLDTHPDYMAFDGAPPRHDEFPVERYRDFLIHVRDHYADSYWPALPRDVARYYMSACSRQPAARPRRACMLSYSFYESDNRVRRYAESLVKQGYQVDAFALRRDPMQPDREVIDGVTLHRIQERRKDEKNPLDHLTRLLRFTFRAARHLAEEHRARRYDLVHVHNPPDFLTFAAWRAKADGARVILDIHDVVPELYGNKFKSAGGEFILAALKWVEKLSMRFADHVIVSNHLWHEKIVRRSVRESKTSVLVNHVDPAIFHPRARTRDDGKFILTFPGSLSWHQGLDIAINAFAKIQHDLPNAEFHIYGVGSARPGLEEQVRTLGLTEKVLFREVVPLPEVPAIMANADLGVVPKRADSFGDEAYSTKIMEFMSQGTPVIASRTKIDSYYFDESVLCFFEPENVDDLASCILRLARDKEYRETLRENGLAYAQRHNWETKKDEYLGVVRRLLNDGTPPPPAHPSPAAVSAAEAASPVSRS